MGLCKISKLLPNCWPVAFWFGGAGSSSSRRAATELLVARPLGIYSAQRRAQVLSAGRKTPFLMVGTEMQAPASLGTTVVPFFANTAKTQNLT